MFGRKHRKSPREKARDIAAALMQQLEEHRKAFAELKAIPDAGERYAALAGFEKTLSGSEKIQTKDDPWAASMSVGGRIVVGVSCVSALFGMILAMTTISIVPLMIALGSVITGGGSALFGDWRQERFDNILAEEMKDAASAVKDLLQEVAVAKQSILDRELKGVAASARFDELYKTFPEVKATFAMAAEREKVLDQHHIVKLDKKRFSP